MLLLASRNCQPAVRSFKVKLTTAWQYFLMLRLCWESLRYSKTSMQREISLTDEKKIERRGVPLLFLLTVSWGRLKVESRQPLTAQVVCDRRGHTVPMNWAVHWPSLMQAVCPHQAENVTSADVDSLPWVSVLSTRQVVSSKSKVLLNYGINHRLNYWLQYWLYIREAQTLLLERNSPYRWREWGQLLDELKSCRHFQGWPLVYAAMSAEILRIK